MYPTPPSRTRAVERSTQASGPPAIPKGELSPSYRNDQLDSAEIETFEVPQIEREQSRGTSLEGAAQDQSVIGRTPAYPWLAAP